MRPSEPGTAANTNHNRKQGTPLHRKNVDTPAMRDIRHLQQSCKTLIPRSTFQRVFREILQALGGEYRVQMLAVQAMQEAAEMYLVQLLEDAYRCTLHRSRVTLQVKDIQLVRILRGVSDPGNA